VTSQGECITDHHLNACKEKTVLAFSYSKKRNMVIAEVLFISSPKNEALLE